MQLKKPTLRQALALAACSVVSGTAAAADSSRVDTSVLFYEEKDRVSVFEPVVFVTNILNEDETTRYHFVYDSLTGASPNGAIATDKVQTFTGASGQAGYTTPAHEMPMPAFNDTRFSLGGEWEKRVKPTTLRTLGGTFSKEEDYLSMSGSLSFAKELNQKHTTVAAGAGLSIDYLQPHGGKPPELTLMSVAAAAAAANAKVSADTVTRGSGEDGEDGDDDDEGFGGERKTVFDVMIGVTQILNRNTLIQVNYSHGFSRGYLNDPYKVVSVVNGTTAQVPSPATGGTVGYGGTVDYLYEKRPDSRNSDVLFFKYVHSFGQDVLHGSYRYFTDSWGIKSNTFDVEYRWALGDSVYIEPQARWYDQTAADFFRYFVLANTQGSLSHVSADLRLAKMQSTTFGVKVGLKMDDSELSLRYATMRQTGDGSSEAFGVIKNYDIHPDLEASMITASYSLLW